MGYLTPEKKSFLNMVDYYHQKNKRSSTITPDYFEPGEMEFLDKYDGTYNPETEVFEIKFEVMGTRYDNRSEWLEVMREGDPVSIIRDEHNKYNVNNFYVANAHNNDLGNLPAQLCNVLAPLYDAEKMIICSAEISYLEPLTKRNKHANKAILFVAVRGTFTK